MHTVRAIESGDCLHLLAQGRVGRVAFTSGALPAIRSVAYSMDGHDVVLDTWSVSLAERLDGQVVAFAVDEVGGRPADWSVVVTGIACRLPGGGQLARPPAAADVAVGEQVRHQLVRISPGLITGRWGGVVAPELPRA